MVLICLEDYKCQGRLEKITIDIIMALLCVLCRLVFQQNTGKAKGLFR